MMRSMWRQMTCWPSCAMTIRNSQPECARSTDCAMNTTMSQRRACWRSGSTRQSGARGSCSRLGGAKRLKAAVGLRSAQSRARIKRDRVRNCAETGHPTDAGRGPGKREGRGPQESSQRPVLAGMPELPTNVYRLDMTTARATVVAGDINRPNGIAFSPDVSKMYIVEAGVTPRVIRAYDVVDDGTKLANSRPFITAEPGGTPDGFRLDVDGNLWCGWGMGNEKQDGVKIFDATGKPIGFIGLPERCANVCFGGVKRNQLFMAASHSLYSLYVNAQGAPGG